MFVCSLVQSTRNTICRRSDILPLLLATSGGFTATVISGFDVCFLLVFCSNHSPKLHRFAASGMEQTNRQTASQIAALFNTPYGRDIINKSVQLPTSAYNVALPVFADACRAAIDRYCLLAGPAAAACGGRTGQTDRQTDGRTDIVPLHRPCSAYCAGSANSSDLE